MTLHPEMRHQGGSIELVVLGLLAALVVVLALPLFVGSEHAESDPDDKAHVTSELQAN